jgi:hypothetical protein
MVMFGDVFSQLVPGEFAIGYDTSNGPCFFKNIEVSVNAGLNK